MKKLILAHKYDPRRHDPTQYLVSEKLDGVRACWTGTDLLTRTGKRLAPPETWTRHLPTDTVLDGELFMGRGRFQDTVSVVRTTKGEDKGWCDVRYHVFDVPGMDAPFEARLDAVRRCVESASNESPLVFVPHERCDGVAQLELRMNAVVEAGGEGLMMRRRGSAYTGGRSWTLLKVKRFHDAEATVIAHVAGKGKHAGRMGALRVRCPTTEHEFKIGTGFDDATREHPPPVGSVVTYRYQELTRACRPRFPSYLRVREPLTK